MSIRLFDNDVKENDFDLIIREWKKDWETLECVREKDPFKRFGITIFENGAEYKANYQVAPVKKRLKSDSYVRDYMYLTSYCRFESDFSNPITVSIKPSFEFIRCEVEPFCPFEVDGGVVRLTVSGPTALVVTFDGNRFENLFLSAEAVSYAPDLTAENVIFFKKGVHNAGTIEVGGGQTLYLEGGAYVYGNVVCHGDNVTVCGKGTICGAKLNHDEKKPREHLLSASGCKDLTISGIMLVDSPVWTLKLYDCHNVVVDGIREICCNENSDGIDVCVSSEVEIKNAFLRNWDDNISVKCRKEDGTDSRCENVTVKDSILWADKAHNMIVGPEGTYTAETLFKNIVFTDIKVLNSAELMFPQGCMCILCADNSEIEDVVFKNIEVYHLQSGRLVNILYTDWFANCLGKRINNVTFENIRCFDSEPMLSRICGEDDTRRVTGIKFKNYRVNGKVQSNSDNTVFTNEFAKVSFDD